jgi:phosphatidylglycerol lysyltransferase
VLLLSGATPEIDTRLRALRHLLPLPVLEISHLAGSVIGLGLLILARALFRRSHAAYHVAFWLLVAGMAASLLKGLDVEEAAFLGLVLIALRSGRAAFYRPSTILSERFTPVWVMSIVAMLGVAIWIGFFAHRHVEYSSSLWWTFALHADAPRMLRAALAVSLLAASFLRRTCAAATSHAERCDRGRARGGQEDRLEFELLDCQRRARGRQAPAVLVGLGRVPDVPGVGPQLDLARRPDRAERRARGTRLAIPRNVRSRRRAHRVLLRSAPRTCRSTSISVAALAGEEARVALVISRSGQRAGGFRDRRAAPRRADGASFVLPVGFGTADPAGVWSELRAVSDAWLSDKATAEKGFSIGTFDEAYLANFPIAVVSAEDRVVAFANLWATESREELSIDLMRFTPDAPRGAMDYLFIELMLWGRAQGYRWFNLGVAPLAGLEDRPLAPAWHRIGNFVFRHGEHFYNFDGLRRYKTKFDPVWQPRYLVSPGGLALPRVLTDVSVLIAGGLRELVAR